MKRREFITLLGGRGRPLGRARTAGYVRSMISFQDTQFSEMFPLARPALECHIACCSRARDRIDFA
jgi:hypothetical protein